MGSENPHKTTCHQIDGHSPHAAMQGPLDVSEPPQLLACLLILPSDAEPIVALLKNLAASLPTTGSLLLRPDGPTATELRLDVLDERRDRPIPGKSRNVRSDSEITQSERDCAFAERALACGDDPEEVIRRIADYRADDKHDPGYYARHTVEEARAAGESVTRSAQPSPQALPDSSERTV